MSDVSTCPSCGGAAEPASRLEPLDFLLCEECGLVFAADLQRERVRDHYAGDEYARERPEYREDSAVFERTASLRAAMVAERVPGGSLLEVGCAQGLLLEAARERGFEVLGVEASPLHAAHARERGLPVLEGFLEDLDLADARFDVACLFHVLEHVVDPRTLLGEVRRLLKPGGTVFVEVPNAGSVMALRDGARWRFLEPGNHPLQFAPRSLRRALELAAFEPVAIDTLAPRHYLPAGRRLRPRPLLGWGYRSLRLRTPRSSHPSGHDLLRAVALKPAA